MTRLLRISEVVSTTGLGRSTVYRLVKENKFPSPVRLSERSSAWREDQIKEWVDSRPVIGQEDAA